MSSSSSGSSSSSSSDDDGNNSSSVSSSSEEEEILPEIPSRKKFSPKKKPPAQVQIAPNRMEKKSKSKSPSPRKAAKESTPPPSTSNSLPAAKKAPKTTLKAKPKAKELVTPTKKNITIGKPSKVPVTSAKATNEPTTPAKGKGKKIPRTEEVTVEAETPAKPTPKKKPVTPAKGKKQPETVELELVEQGLRTPTKANAKKTAKPEEVKVAEQAPNKTPAKGKVKKETKTLDKETNEDPKVSVKASPKKVAKAEKVPVKKQVPKKPAKGKVNQSPEFILPDDEPKSPATATEVDKNGVKKALTMSESELEEFLSRVDEQCPLDDGKPAKTRENAIDWSKVAFSCYSPEDCKEIWLHLQNTTRKFRIMHELVEEMRFGIRTNHQKYMKKVIEALPDFPKQSYRSGGFQVYCMELWDGHKLKTAKPENFVTFQKKRYTEWEKLPEETKKEYNEKAVELKATYNQRVQEYFAQFPGFDFNPPKKAKVKKEGTEKGLTENTRRKALKMSKELYPDAPQTPLPPLQLFINSKMRQLDPPPDPDQIPSLKSHYIERWKSLSNKKKAKWIDNCINKCEQYMKDVTEYKKSHPLFVLPKEFQISKIISRDEFTVWAESKGLPPKPKHNSFDLFFESYRELEEASGTEEEMKKAAWVKWEELDKYEKEMYQINFKMECIKYKKEFEVLYNQMPEILKPLAVESLPKRYKSKFLEESNGASAKAEKRTLSESADEEPVPKRTRNDEVGDDSHSQADEGESGVSPKKKKKKLKNQNEPTENNEKQDAPGYSLYMDDLTPEHIKLLTQETKDVGESKTVNHVGNSNQAGGGENPEDAIPGPSYTVSTPKKKKKTKTKHF